MDVFVGFYYDEEKEAQLLSVTKAGISAAANQYQKGFLSGLSPDLEVLTTISTGVYPSRCRKLRFPRETKAYGQGRHTYLPFWNVHFIKNWMFRRGLYKHLCNIIRNQPHTTVYVYSLNVVFEKVMARIKKKFADRVHYCLIIPDLPGSYGIVRRGIKGMKDRMDAKPKMTLAAAADSYVFLTEAMKELFPPKPSVIIEGFLPAGEFDRSAKRIPKTILYTGTLGGKFGIDKLLEAFSMIPDPEYRLWICGSGEMEKAVTAAAEKDPRIEFKGFLPKKEITYLQSTCDVLINPRQGEGEYVRYSFPSKTMEYLLSGSKVVMYRLPGITEDYYRYIRVVDGQDASALARAMETACRDEEFYRTGWQQQVAWIQEEKSAESQVQKALQMIKNQKQFG